MTPLLFLSDLSMRVVATPLFFPFSPFLMPQQPMLPPAILTVPPSEPHQSKRPAATRQSLSTGLPPVQELACCMRPLNEPRTRTRPPAAAVPHRNIAPYYFFPPYPLFSDSFPSVLHPVLPVRNVTARHIYGSNVENTVARGPGPEELLDVGGPEKRGCCYCWRWCGAAAACKEAGWGVEGRVCFSVLYLFPVADMVGFGGLEDSG